jgi:secreted Zn-dependent insulinase-like peptidase
MMRTRPLVVRCACDLPVLRHAVAPTAARHAACAVVFRTPVDNSYGIPHILEHSVLCGSRKYPIKVRGTPELCVWWC